MLLIPSFEDVMLMRILQRVKAFLRRMLEVDIRYTSVPVWKPWRDYSFTIAGDSDVFR